MRGRWSYFGAARAVAVAALVALPLTWLWDLHAGFYFDWYHNLWMIGYTGEYWRVHGSFPVTFNSLPSVGTPLPIFYGFVLYPMLAPLAAWAGAAVALRIGLGALVLTQVHALLAAGRTVGIDRRLSFVVAASVVWSVYSLTNLYNRAAIPEYFAVGLLVASLGYGISASAQCAPGPAFRYGWLAVLCAALSAATHPPTALLAAPFLAVLTGIGAVEGFARARRYPAFRAAVGGAAGAAVGGLALLAPWLYASFRLARDLTIEAPGGPLTYYPHRSDSWLGRFAPIPYDEAAWRHVAAQTPYLEAPVSVGLIVLLAWNFRLWLSLRRTPSRPNRSVWEGCAGPVMLASGIWFVVALAISLPLPGTRAVTVLTPYVQFGYRLVSHCNAALLVMVLASGSWLAARSAYPRYRTGTRIVLGAAFALGGTGLLIKLAHAHAVQQIEASPMFAWSGPRNALVEGGDDWLDQIYATPRRFLELPGAVRIQTTPRRFPVGSGPGDFGTVHSFAVDQPQAGWVLTDAVAFPWTRIQVNGRRAEAVARCNYLLAVRLPAGHSVVAWWWRPDPIWATLYRWSRGALAVLLVLTAAGAAACLPGRDRF